MASASGNSERREYEGINASFENASENNRTLGTTHINDETRCNSHDGLSELPDPGTQFDRQSPTHYMPPGGTSEGHHMVTEAKEQIHNRHYTVTGQTVHTNQNPEFLTGRTQIPRNPSSHQYQNLSTQVSQNNHLPVVEQTPENQNLDANNSINRLADGIAGITTQQRPQAATMLKPVSTNTLIFDGKNEKFELFEDLFHTMLRMQPEMTEAMKINHFHAHLRKDALQTFRNISAVNRKTLDEVLIVFRRKHVKLESQATAKHKWHKLTFDTNTKSLPDFLEEPNECAERAFGNNAQHMIDSLLYAKLPPHLKRSLNLAHLENGTYDQIVAHLERELELSGLENDGELTIPTMTTVPLNDNQQNTEQTKVVCHYCKKPGHVIRECRVKILNLCLLSRSEFKYFWTKGLEHSPRGKPGPSSSNFKALMLVMLECTIPVLEKERKLFLQKVRFILNFSRNSRFLVKFKVVKAGNWRSLWESKANKRFWITKPLFCVIRYNVSNTWRWWISNQRVDMRNCKSKRCWKKTSRLIRREHGDGIDNSGLSKSQPDVQKQRIFQKLEDSKKKVC